MPSKAEKNLEIEERMVVSKPTSIVTNSTPFFLLIPNKTPKTHQHQHQRQHLFYVSNPSSAAARFPFRFNNCSLLSSPQQSQHTHFGFPSLCESKRGNMLSVYALSKQGKDGTALMEMSHFDDENYDVYDDDDVDEGMFLPFGKMKKWLENKPRGFGEEKVYDTSMEDKLLDEMEQSKQAQAANINNLKSNPVKPAAKKENQNRTAVEVVPHGIRVHVINLPKKKNIHRDLKSAFKDVPGIVNIIPAVSGNKKTKDPICKGFAFVDFGSEEDAIRFVQLFSWQSVAFGKIQKQIKCKLTNLNSSRSFDDESAGSFCSNQPLIVPDLEGDLNADFRIDNSSFEETASDICDDSDNELKTATLEEITENVESFSMNGYDSTGPRIETVAGPFSPKKRNKHQASKKKIIVKGRGEKVPKLDIPGSAKRLKIKEKAILTDVFNKYALKAALASGEKN